MSSGARAVLISDRIFLPLITLTQPSGISEHYHALEDNK